MSLVSGHCTELVDAASWGVAPALRAVDCVAGDMTALAFNRLFGAEGALAPVLTILLTLYIAFFALALLLGRSRLSVPALTPRMLTLGLVLTFATSWVAYQGVLWNLAVAGPDWIAGVLMGGVSGAGNEASATRLFADRIDIVFAAIGELGQAVGAGGTGGGEGAGPPAGAAGMFQPADVLWLGALLLLLGTVGVLLTARIALAILLALGPVFVVMALFGGTRGLTAGWLRGVVLTALAPLFVVLGGSITLELLVPVLRALGQNAALGAVTGRGAMAVFLLAAVHVALMAMVMKVAMTMVTGWQVFGLARPDREQGGANLLAGPAAYAGMAAGAAAPAGAAPAYAARRAPVVLHAAGMEGAASAGSHGSGLPAGPERRTVVTQVSGGGIEPLRAGGTGSRARGIGSRFRGANDSGRAGPAGKPGAAAREMIR